MRNQNSCLDLITWLLTSLAIWSVTVLSTSTTLCAQSPNPREVMPATTLFYAEGSGSDTLLQLPIVKELTGSALFDKVWKSPEAMKLRGGITLAEVALGERLPEALGKLTARGWTLAFDGHTKGVVLWAHTRDAAACQEQVKKLLTIAQADAKSKGKEIKQISYRDVDAFEVNGAAIAGLAEHLVISNKGELLKTIVDRWRDPPADGDHAGQRFQELSSHPAASESSAKHAPSLARAWLDMQQLRESGLAKKMFEQPHENFGVELLAGGIFASLQQASTIEFRLAAEDKQLSLQVITPPVTHHDTKRYEYFFGPDSQGHAPALIELGGTQANLSLYRDIAQLWLRAGDIFGQKTNDQLAQAETTLSTLFSGRDFASDILGAIRPELQLIVTEQKFGKSAPVPQVKLPAFALVTQLRDPQTMQPQLKRIFMSLVGFLNVTSAMNQQPQLDLESSRLESGWEVAATYAVEADRPKNWIVPVQYNFSPTLLMVQDYAVISSTQGLAQAIQQKLQDPASKEKVVTAAHSNSILNINGQLLNDLLAANRQQLISQNMVEKGHSQEEAEGEVDVVLQALQMMRSLSVAFTVHDGTELKVDLELASPERPACSS